MNNEPVAWMSQGGDVSRSADYFVEMGFTDLIPLYTHPVKELTDEEIIAVGNAVVMVDESGDIIRDVRSDLKGDIDSLQADVDAAERRNRELDKEVRGFVGVTDRDMSARLRTIERETDQKLKELEKKVDEKIKQAWENPLAN